MAHESGPHRFSQLISFVPDRELRKRLRLEASLYQTLQILSVTLFEKTPILSALQAIDMEADFAENINQLILFDF